MISDLFQWTRTHIQYDFTSIESYRYRSPESLISDKMGKCYDIANYIAIELSKMKEVEDIEMIVMIIETSKGNHNHAITVYRYQSAYYFMELTNGRKLGIHGGFTYKFEIIKRIEDLFNGPLITNIRFYKFPSVEYGVTENEIIESLGDEVSFDDNIHYVENFGTKTVIVLFYKHNPIAWKPLHDLFVQHKMSVCMCKDAKLLHKEYGDVNYLFIGDNWSMPKQASSIGAKCVTICSSFEDIISMYTGGKEYIASQDKCICEYEDISSIIPMYSELYEYRDYPFLKIGFDVGDDTLNVVKDGSKHYTISYFADRNAKNILYRYDCVCEGIYKLVMTNVSMRTEIKKLIPFKTCVESDIMIFIDPEIEQPKWWIDKCIEQGLGYCIDGRDVMCKRGYSICKASNIDSYKDLTRFVLSDKPIENEDDCIFIFHEGENHIRSVYGTESFCLFEANGDYDFLYSWIFSRFFELYQFDSLTNVSYNLYHMFAEKFDVYDMYNLTETLNMYAKEHKKIFTSDDFTSLGHGWFNVAYRINDDVIRIHINDESPFDEEGAKTLMSNSDNGFVPVKEVGYRYTVLAACEPLPHFDVNDIPKDISDKLKLMLEKNRKFFIEHQNLCYCDYHYDNIMQYKNEFVVVDIDLNMMWDGNLHMKEDIETFVDGREGKLNYNMALYNAILDYAKIRKTLLTMTLTAIEIFEVTGYRVRSKLTMEMIDDVADRLRKELDGIDLIDSSVSSYNMLANYFNRKRDVNRR